LVPTAELSAKTGLAAATRQARSWITTQAEISRLNAESVNLCAVWTLKKNPSSEWVYRFH